MDVKVGDLVSIKSDFPGRNFNIDYLSSLGVVTYIFQSALLVDKGDHNYRDCAFVEWISIDKTLKVQPDCVQPFYSLLVISEI